MKFSIETQNGFILHTHVFTLRHFHLNWEIIIIIRAQMNILYVCIEPFSQHTNIHNKWMYMRQYIYYKLSTRIHTYKTVFVNVCLLCYLGKYIKYLFYTLDLTFKLKKSYDLLLNTNTSVVNCLKKK